MMRPETCRKYLNCVAQTLFSSDKELTTGVQGPFPGSVIGDVKKLQVPNELNDFSRILEKAV